MTKLISRNPIQRFKEGRKIVKAKDGYVVTTPTNETIGNYIREKNRSLFGSGWRWYDTRNPRGRDHVALDKEVEVDGWILKPNGSKVAVVARNNSQQNSTSQRNPSKKGQVKVETQNSTNNQRTITNNNKSDVGSQKTIVTQGNKNVQSSADAGITSGKNSINFKTAFNNARNSGLQEFTWRGQKYNTKKAGEENYIWQNGNWVSPNQSALTFKPIDNLSLELPKVTVSDLAGLSGNTSVVQPTKVEPVIQPRNYFNYTLPNYDLIAQNRLKQSGIRTYLKQGGNLKFKFSNKG